MKRMTVNLWTKEEYPYKGACGFLPKLDGYLHEEGTGRPSILIAPGGAYHRCSPEEGEPVALRFFEMGYQAFVCSYTIDQCRIPLRRQPLMDLAKGVAHVRANALAYLADPDKITVCGFSAGGHAAATLGVHWQDAEAELKGISCRPDALLLCYPVVTVFTDIAHQTTSLHLLGEEADEAEREYMRLDRQVRGDCPPVFLWHTVTDDIAPVDNSVNFAMACRKHGVPFALHLYSDGPHGLSLADGTPQITEENSYALEQTLCTIRALEEGRLVMDEEQYASYVQQREVRAVKRDPSLEVLPNYHPEVCSWPKLADGWIRQRLG